METFDLLSEQPRPKKVTMTAEWPDGQISTMTVNDPAEFGTELDVAYQTPDALSDDPGVPVLPALTRYRLTVTLLQGHDPIQFTDPQPATSGNQRNRVTRDELIAAATELHDQECRSCDRKYRMSCPNMANAVTRAGEAMRAGAASRE